jgi:excisionase family DNA binding protein
MDKQWISVEEAAKELDVHPETIRTWIKEGILNAVAVKRTFRIRRTDFDEFVKRHETGRNRQ